MLKHNQHNLLMQLGELYQSSVLKQMVVIVCQSSVLKSLFDCCIMTFSMFFTDNQEFEFM
uniref:Uncharacterized protein n=1 Tax=Rhizophora mucronata TaxID=61149 RepID=A0A2P2J022_RHIMU